MAVETVEETDPATWGRIQWAAFGVGFEAGCFRGYEACRRAVEAHNAALWEDCSRRVRAVAGSPSHAVLRKRRGYDAPGPRPGDYLGGPVDWETGRPMRLQKVAS